MDLHKGFDDQFFAELKFDDDLENLEQRKNVKRLLEDRLEQKRLRDEFRDDFDELNGDFDWDEIEK